MDRVDLFFMFFPVLFCIKQTRKFCQLLLQINGNDSFKKCIKMDIIIAQK